MKKIICLLLVLLALALPLSVSAAANPVVDEADLLTDEQEYELTQLFGEQGINVLCVVTLKSLDGEDIEDCATDWVESSGVAVLFMISMEERQWCITSAPEYEGAIDGFAIEQISAQCQPYLSSGEYYEAFATFAYCCEGYLDGYVPGEHVSGGSGGGFGRFLICLILGLAAGGITAGILAGKNRSVRPQGSAANYVRSDSMRVTVSRDIFLYNTVTRTPKPQNNSSGGSRGGGSRSTRSGSF